MRNDRRDQLIILYKYINSKKLSLGPLNGPFKMGFKNGKILQNLLLLPTGTHDLRATQANDRNFEKKTFFLKKIY